MSNHLGKAETALKSLFENNVSGFSRSSLVTSLTEAVLVELRGKISLNTGGENLAPDHIVVHADRKTWMRVNKYPGWIQILKDNIHKEAGDAHAVFRSPLRIDPVEDEGLGTGVFLVECDWQVGVASQTQAMDGASNPGNTPAEKPWRSFLIADGKEISLRGSVFNLGRRETNDLVINDERVSRRHAQIRMDKGSTSIFDLNSTGGTFVNNIRVRSKVLKPGDVISLAGYPLIFHRDFDLDRTDEIKMDLVVQEGT